jgi:hypothetical protein
MQNIYNNIQNQALSSVFFVLQQNTEVIEDQTFFASHVNQSLQMTPGPFRMVDRQNSVP